MDTEKEQIRLDSVSNFCLVCYYDNKTKELVRIEQYKDNSSDIQTDINSYKYGYNAEIIKPEELINQLVCKTQECEKLSILAQEESARNGYIEYELNDKLKQKTQKCEEQENKIKKLRKNLALEIESNTRYRNALEEIEEYCNKQIAVTGDLPFKTTESDILDIINKAKGNNND